MIALLAAALAGALAAAIAGLELITSRYRNTYPFLWRSWHLFVYMAAYGAAAFALTLSFEYLATKGMLDITAKSPWLQAVLVGVSTKALMNITLFNVVSGAGTVPIGLATLTHMYEPFLLSELDLKVWNDVRSFLAPYAGKYTDIAAVRTRIEQNLPPTLSIERRAALLADIKARDTVAAVFEAYLYAVGRDTFVGSFPL